MRKDVQVVTELLECINLLFDQLCIEDLHDDDADIDICSYDTCNCKVATTLNKACRAGEDYLWKVKRDQRKRKRQARIKAKVQLSKRLEIRTNKI